MDDVSSPPPGKSPTAVARWKTASRFIGAARKFRQSLEPANRRKEALRTTLEKEQILGLVSAATHRFMQGDNPKELKEARQAGFGISAAKASSLVWSCNSGDNLIVPDTEDVARRLCSSIDSGIRTDTQPTPSARQEIFGSNVYKDKIRKSFWTFLGEAMSDITIDILLCYSIVSMTVECALKGWGEGSYGGGLEILFSAFVVSAVIAYWDYTQYMLAEKFTEQNKKVSAMRDGKRECLSPRDILVGEIVFLSSGEEVPADGICILDQDLLVDMSSIDEKCTEPLTVNQQHFRLLAGTRVIDGSGKMLVVSVGKRTCSGRLITTPSRQSEQKESPLLEQIHLISIIMAAICFFFLLLSFLVQYSGLSTSGVDSTFLKYVEIALNVFIVGVPACMSLVVKLNFCFVGMQLLKNGSLVKHPSSFEKMPSVTHICLTKTGTLTNSQMVVNRVLLCGEVVFSQPAANVLGSARHRRALDIFWQSVFLNTGSVVVQHSGDEKQTCFGTPMELSLLNFALSTEGHHADRYEPFKKLLDVPFTSHSKIRSVLVVCPDKQIRTFCTGAADIVLSLCSNVITSNGESLDFSAEIKDGVLDTINGFCHEGLKTVCLAFKDVDPSDVRIPDDGYTLIAVVGISYKLRSEVKDFVQRCSEAGITVQLVTGDDIIKAKATAKEYGILTGDGLAVESQTLFGLGQEELKRQILNNQVIASCSAEQKCRVVNYLKSASGRVAVVGSGISDTPFIQEADIGFAMGVAGAKSAKEGADVVILDDDLTTIAQMAKWGRAVHINISDYVQFQLTWNAVALAVQFVSLCYSGDAVFPAVLLLWVNIILGTSSVFALFGEPTNKVMNRPPVIKGETLITSAMWRNIVVQSLWQSTLLIGLIFYGRSLLRLEGPGATDMLGTFIFYTFVLGQVFGEIKEQVGNMAFLDLCSSWKVTAIMVSRLILPGIIVVFLCSFAHSVLLSGRLWFISICLGSTTMVISFLLKFIPEDHDRYQPLASSP